MEINYPKLDYKKYLSIFSLNFFIEKDQQLYSQMAYQHKKAFLKFVIFWVVFTFISISCLQYDVYMREYDFIPLFIFLTIAILMYILIQKVQNSFILDIFLASIILGLNIFIVEISVPSLFNKYMLDKNNNDLNNKEIIWLCLFLGVHLKTLNSIMASAQIRWYIVSTSYFIVSALIFRNFIYNYKLNSPGGVLMTMILSSFFLPILITYIDERKIKELFLNLIRAKENLSGFEDLIESIIPCHIIILNGERKEILYCNSSAKNFFHVLDDKQVLLQKLKKINLIEQNLNFFEFSQFLIDKNKVSIDGTINDSNEVYNCSFKSERNEMYFFDINFKFAHWRNLEVILIVLNDISFKMQGLNEINQYKDMILATISHNLRTPLNSIYGCLKLTADEIQNNSNCTEYISTAQSSCKTLLSLINDILDFSQISSHTLKLNFKEFFISKTIHEILENINIQIKKKKLKFLCSFCEEFERIKIKADPNRFQQILMNLIENAIKYTFQGQINFIVNLEKCAYHNNEHQAVVFKIVDTGIGIEEERLDEIFKLYRKISHEDYENRECLGFGLSISQHLAKAMHEEGITVTSILNVGSEFRFSLPYNLENEALRSEESPFMGSFKEKSIYHSGRFNTNIISGSQKCLTKQSTKMEMPSEILDKGLKINVLIVDDDVLNNLIHEKYVENFGFESEVAMNGKEALEKIEKNAKVFKFFSLILLDCNMPVLNGFETAKKIRFLIENEVIPYVPIIAITANVTINDIDHCQRSGMDYYLSKPVSRRRLWDKIAEAFNNMKNNKKIL